MSFLSPMDVGAVLRQLQQLRIRCIGARPRGVRGMEFVLEHPEGPDVLAGALEQAWPSATASTVLERTGEGTRMRLEIAPGLHLRWSMATPVTAGFSPERHRTVRPRPTQLETPAPLPDHRPHQQDDNRLAAFEVGRSDGEDELDVVLASTPEEAARCFLKGWGVPDGSLLAVRWNERPEAIAVAADGRHDSDLPNLRVFRVIHGAVVAIPGWSS